MLLSSGEGGTGNALSANLRIVGQGLRKFSEWQSHAGLEQGTGQEEKGVDGRRGGERVGAAKQKRRQWKGT
jgi:hypothetical protein